MDDNTPSLTKTNPVVLLVGAVLAFIGLFALLVWAIMALANHVLRHYHITELGFSEALALTLLALLFGGLIGGLARGDNKQKT